MLRKEIGGSSACYELILMEGEGGRELQKGEWIDESG